MTRNRIAELFQTAINLHSAGNFLDAEKFYRRVLSLDKNHTDSLHNLAHALNATGRGELALPLLDQAARLAPTNLYYLQSVINIGENLQDWNRVAYFASVLCLIAPADAIALRGLGHAAGSRSNFTLQSKWLARLLAIEPHNAPEWLTKAVSDFQCDSPAVASSSGAALAAFPAHITAIQTFLAAHLQSRAVRRFEAWFARLFALDKNNVVSLNLYGLFLANSGANQEAEQKYREAIATNSAHADGYANLLALYATEGRWDAAIEIGARALALDPRHINAMTVMVLVFGERGYHHLARRFHDYVLSERPDNFKVRANFVKALLDQGLVEDANRSLAISLSLAPSNALVLLTLSKPLRESGLANLASQWLCRAMMIDPLDTISAQIAVFTLAYSTWSRAQIFEVHRQAALGFQFGLPIRRIPNLPLKRSGAKKRIGFVSGDLRQHPVAFLLLPILQNLDRESYDIVTYSTGDGYDQYSKMIEDQSTSWRNALNLSDQNLYDQIVQDQIDVLIDLSGYTKGNRLKVFAAKPAPVQMSWIGYYDTTGLDQFDAILMDEWICPPGDERFFTEPVYRLSGGRFCYMPPVASPPVAPAPYLRNGALTFGVFNNPAKWSDAVLQFWALILREFPNARLVLKWEGLDRAALRSKITSRLENFEIDLDRISFRGFSTHYDSLAEYGDIDISLDTFPFNGGMTTIESLWMGVPVLALIGDRPISRQSFSILNSAGLSQWAFQSPDGLIEALHEFEGDREKLQSIRAGLRSHLSRSDLFDGKRIAREFTACLNQIGGQTQSQPAS